MQTHDYTARLYGHDFTILEVFEGGQELKAAGWGLGIEKDDYLILPQTPMVSTRYQVKEIKYKDDPSDMWFATLTFAPRTKE